MLGDHACSSPHSTFVLAALGVRSSGQTAVAVFEQVSVVPMDRERVSPIAR